MFSVYADNNLIYDSRTDLYLMSKGQITLETNKSAKFVFTIYKDHPFYSSIEKLKTIVKVYRDESLIYRGRVIKSVDGFNNDRVFTCEGELSFLLDSIQRPYSFRGSPTALFTQLITNHNSQVESDKQFTVGLVTVTDPNDYINRSNSEYEDTLTNLNDRLVDPLGGYIVITPGENDNRVINWLSSYPVTASQEIRFGENLLNFAKTTNAETIATAIIPLGAEIAEGENEGQRVTIKSVNDGLDYIYDAEAVAEYGWIFAVVIWEDVTLPRNLLNKATAYISELRNLIVSIELSAVDLSDMDKDIEAFKLGDMIHVVSEPHNLNATYMLTKQSIDLLHPENNKITLGYSYGTFSEKTLATANVNARLMAAAGEMATKQSVQAIGNEVIVLTGDMTAANIKIEAIEGTEWTGLTLDPGFTHDPPLDNPLMYRVANNQVFVRGFITPLEDILSSDTPVTVATGIPETYWPPYDLDFLLPGDGLATFVCTVTAAGEITIAKYGTAGVYGTITTASSLGIHLSYAL